MNDPVTSEMKRSYDALLAAVDALQTAARRAADAGYRRSGIERPNQTNLNRKAINCLPLCGLTGQKGRPPNLAVDALDSESGMLVLSQVKGHVSVTQLVTVVRNPYILCEHVRGHTLRLKEGACRRDLEVKTAPRT